MVLRVGLLDAPDGSVGVNDKYQLATLISFGVNDSERLTGPINFYSRSLQFDTLLYCKFEGNDGDLTTDDSSPNMLNPLVSHGTAFIDAIAPAGVGSSSVYFAEDNIGTGGNTYFSTDGGGQPATWNFFQKNFTIEFYAKWETNNDFVTGFQQFNMLLTWQSINSMQVIYEWGISSSAPDLINKFSYNVSRTFGSSFKAYSAIFVPDIGVWYHIKFVKESPNHTWYINGAQSGTATVSTEDGLDVSSLPLFLGGGVGGTPNLQFNGWMDELIITKNNNDPVAGAPINFYSKSNSSAINFYGQ